MTPLKLKELKIALKELLMDDATDLVLDRLKSIIPPNNSGRFNTLILLQRDNRVIKEMSIRGTQSFEAVSVKQASFLENLINFIDSLSIDDFHSATEPDYGDSHRKTPTNRTGSVLYGIPNRMTVGKERQCVVRLAYNAAILDQDLQPGDELQIKAIRRIDERMEVELIDPNEEPAFTFRTINSAIQRVEEGDFTEWIYFVKPTKAGIHDLWLKVVVIIKKDGEKIKKDIVLQEKIEVVTHEEKEEAVGVPLKQAGLYFFVGLDGMSGAGHDGDPTPTGAETGGAVSKGLLASLAQKFTPIIGGAVLVGGLYLGISEFNKADEVPHTAVEQKNMEPELDDSPKRLVAWNDMYEDPPADTVFRLDPRETHQLETLLGTILRVPPLIFVDDSDRVLKDSITILVREIHHPLEIIAHDIPMRFYDEAQKERWMQTAGMLKIEAYCNGKPAKIRTGKSIEMDFVSAVAGDYAFWSLDSTGNNWSLEDENPSWKRTALGSQPIQSEIRELEASTKTPPRLPRFYENRRYEVAAINLRCCPELTASGGKYIRLTYAGADPALSPENNEWLEQRTWRKRTMHRSTQDHNAYVLTYEAADTTFHVELRPALESEQKEELLAEYNSRKAAFQQKLALLQQKRQLMAQQYAFRRSARIRNLGIYNFDILLKEESAVQLAADFDFGEMHEDIKEAINVYLITADRRSVIKFPANQWDQFRYLAGTENQLLALLPDRKIGVFTDQDFQAERTAIQQATEEGTTYRFRMQILDFDPQQLEDFELLLNG